MSVEILKKQLKSGDFARLYLLYGEEGYLKSFYCDEIVHKVVSGMESFNLHRFDADNFDLSLFAAAVDNLPLMSDRKCIVLRDIDPESFKEKEWKEFQQMLRAIPEECVLVLHYDAIAYEKSKSRWKTLLGIAQKEGLAVEVGRQPKNVLAKWLTKKAGESGCSLSADNIDCLITNCGEDMTLLACEMEKLCAYTQSGEIQRQTIDALVSKPLDASIYDLAHAVTAGRVEQALTFIDELFYRREEPVVVLSALSGAFCDLYRAKTALLAGARQEDLVADFNYRGREFRVRNAMHDCAKLDLNMLRASIELLMKADESLKSTRTDKRVILERLVVDIAGLRKRVGTR